MYGLKAEQIETKNLEREEIEESRRRFESWDWILGKKIDFQHELSNRFPWGQFTMQVKVNCGKIEDAVIFSDSMETSMIPKLPEYLSGVIYSKKAICSALACFKPEGSKEEEMLHGIAAWLETVEL
ncbi:MAG: lipoate protein ligase C-terminal domain-containing protein [Muricomes sp.]